jgi:exopolysaccharide biosynthesis polyprenyl glycosylphosphotransferase
MSSSVELPKTQITQTDKTLSADLQVVYPRAAKSTATHFRRGILACEILADLLTITCAIRFGYAIYGTLNFGKHIHFSLSVIWAAGAIFSTVLVLMLDRVGAYRRGNSLLRVRETEQILRVSAEALLTVLTVSFFAQILVPRLLPVFCLSFVLLFLLIQKSLLYLIVHALHSRGYGNERVLIYGAGCTGRRVFSVLRASPKLGLPPVAVVDDDLDKVGSALFEMAYERRSSAHIIQGPVTRELLANRGIDLVIIAIPTIDREKFVATVEECLAANVRVSFVPSHLMSFDAWLDYRDIDGILLASFGKPAIRLSYEVAKRVFDVAASLLSIVLASPLFFFLAFLVKIDSKGPVFFRQERIGCDGRPFLMYKFRTMRTSASAYDYSPRESSDPRITRIGRFLRKTSLDELPQLFNVLQGQMSLVGPRPEMPFIVKEYTQRQRQRLGVKPGLTGLWQLSGDRAFLIHENIEYDLYYIRNRNFFMDLAVILHTLIFAMRGI